MIIEYPALEDVKNLINNIYTKNPQVLGNKQNPCVTFYSSQLARIWCDRFKNNGHSEKIESTISRKIGRFDLPKLEKDGFLIKERRGGLRIKYKANNDVFPLGIPKEQTPIYPAASFQ